MRKHFCFCIDHKGETAEGGKNRSITEDGIQFLVQGRHIRANTEGHGILSLSGLSKGRILRDGLMRVKVQKAVLN